MLIIFLMLKVKLQHPKDLRVNVIWKTSQVKDRKNLLMAFSLYV